MKITEIRLGSISVPLRVPFKTALRTVTSVEDIILEIHTDTGEVGYGAADGRGDRAYHRCHSRGAEGSHHPKSPRQRHRCL